MRVTLQIWQIRPDQPIFYISVIAHFPLPSASFLLRHLRRNAAAPIANDKLRTASSCRLLKTPVKKDNTGDLHSFILSFSIGSDPLVLESSFNQINRKYASDSYNTRETSIEDFWKVP